MVSELADIIDRLRVKHAHFAAITAEFARAIDALEHVTPYLSEDESPGITQLATAVEARAPSAALPLFPSTDGVRQTSPKPPLNEGRWARRLHGLTQYEALVRIAEDNDGILRTTDARDIFLRARIARGKPRNINGHIHHMLSRSDEFEKVAPGVFRLVPPELPPREVNASVEEGALSLRETV
ncbi:MAG: hypothetical protein ACRDJH_21415, partial [Thermomicrobiales bacterium]